MGDPVGASAHVYSTLSSDGSWMIVEPFANDDVADNLTPVGRVFYSASTMVCTPSLTLAGGWPRPSVPRQARHKWQQTSS